MEQPGVVGVHSLRIWSLSAYSAVVSAHLEVHANTDTQVVIKYVIIYLTGFNL